MLEKLKFWKKDNKQENTALYGDELNFAAHEAYRLLRTNLIFSFSGEKKCRVIGIVSADKGEGKTTTSINLSYVLAESGAKVCLVEGDMRIPQIEVRLDLKNKRGLSELLTGQATLEQVAQTKKFAQCQMTVISSGRIPPNPSELLSSAKMEEVMQKLSEKYDYIILDLPPVNIVTDAVVSGKIVDGVAVVVGQGIAQRKILRSSMRQLSMANIKILGFICTFASVNGFTHKRTYTYKSQA